MSKTDIIDEFNNGDKQKAISAAVAEVDAHPHDYHPYAVLSAMLINMRDYDQAAELLDKALGLFHEQPELRYNWGLLAYQQGEYKDALARLLPITGPDTKKSLRGDANYMVALSYQGLEEPLRALAFAMTAHDLNPQAEDATILTANLLMASGAFAEAKRMLQPLVKHGSGQVLVAYGMVLGALGEDGSKYLDAAKDADPDAYKRARELLAFMNEQHKDAAGDTDGK
ncbi:tetratricopeptide repeat protein [Lacticaseibacillus zhaodongensis]|uniref:tetratricopeptide repeat protein n=1 Tax=Lacticaseibacillus zhaodongensis TaxID=2668065 RepID=UPI0012D33A87|nr:tetratricopeptide repeat protein [Lacticaseibacillus zhaodongensis]